MESYVGDITELYILGRERLQVLYFFHWTTTSAHKPAFPWREILDIVVILVRGFAKILLCQKKAKNTVLGSSFSISGSAKRLRYQQ